MPRPKCCRKIGYMPDTTYYHPEGESYHSQEEIVLTLDEFEAIRLADHEDMYQEQAALRMNISRQTFGRIIEAAHKKIAEVLIMGKALRIEGGDVSIRNKKSIRCDICKKAIECSDKSTNGICPHCRKLPENRDKI
jgi:predicted DNA-binding protein (UPF0251 family)